MFADRFLMTPTNFEPELLERLAPLRPAYIYGSLPEESTLRSPLNLPEVSEELVADHVAAAAELGIKFIYVMNATSTNNREQSEEGRWELLQRCQWLTDMGAAGVVIANPFVLEIVRTAYPELETHVSVLAEVDSPNAARFYDDLGVSVIHLAPKVNREIPKLATIRKAVSCRLSVLANEGCLLECPMRRYHAAVLSNSVESVSRGYHVDYCYHQCSLMKATDPAHYLRMPWIRPEDLQIYEDIGLDMVKVAGREKMGDGPSSHTDWIVNVAQAFHDRKSDDIAELLVGIEPVESPFVGAGATSDVRIKVHSDRLDGFIAFFTKGLCTMDCGTCRYCDKWAEKTVTVEGDPVGYQAQISRTIDRIRVGDYVTGRPA